MRIPFVGQTYQSLSPNISAERCVNFYPEINQIGDKGNLSMIGTPGYVQYIDLIDDTTSLPTNLPIRGMYVFQGVLLIVSGNKLYRYDDTSALAHTLGTLQTSAGPLTFRDNGSKVLGIGGNQVLITDGTSAYLWEYDSSIVTGTFTDLITFTNPSYTNFMVTYTSPLTIYCKLDSVSQNFVNGDSIKITGYTPDNHTVRILCTATISSITTISSLNCRKVVLTSVSPSVTNLIGWLQFEDTGGTRSAVRFDSNYPYYSNSPILIDGDHTSTLTPGLLLKLYDASNNLLANTSVKSSTYYSTDNFTVTYYDESASGAQSFVHFWTHINILSSSLPITGVSTCEFLDGYFIVNGTGSMNAYASNLYDGETWNALAFNPIQATNDPLLAVVALHEQLWHIKSFSSEVWYNAGTPTSEGYPFSRISGGVIDYGTVAPYSIAKLDNSIVFLGTQRLNESAEFVGVVQITGAQPQIISTPAITYQISQLTTLSDAIAFAYKLASHTFYVLTFPADNRTFVYDASNAMWHEWSSYQSPYSIRRHIANCYAYYNGKHLIGDSESAKIYELSDAYYSDNGTAIISERITPVIYDDTDFENLFIHKLIVDAETGVGNSSDYDPQASLSWSDDFHTWSNEIPASIGGIGSYKTQLIWRRLGRSKLGRIFKLRIASKTRKVILGAYAKVSK